MIEEPTLWLPEIEEPIPTAPSPQSAEKVNILLVDDNPGKLLAHETILGDLNENIVKARSGSQALEMLLQRHFAVILLDVNMPGLDGFETATLIRQHPRFETTPIIFVTAFNTTDLDRLKGYELGAVDYIFLPVIPQVLKAKVEVFVKLARQKETIQRQADDLARQNRELATQLHTNQLLNKKLRDANQALEFYTYTVSHDLRAPLRHMTGFCELLLDEYGPGWDERARKSLLAIKRSALTMDQLTNDLLQYVRIMRQDVQLEPVLLNALVSEIILAHPPLQSPNCQVTIDSELLPVLGHPTLLTQALTNLLLNAAKFVRPGVTPKIHVWTQARGDFIRIWVEDNGIGIAPAYHEKIFGLFERVGDVKKYEGTGVGLAIVARAAVRMHGSYGLESALGAGSRFWIELQALPDK